MKWPLLLWLMTGIACATVRVVDNAHDEVVLERVACGRRPVAVRYCADRRFAGASRKQNLCGVRRQADDALRRSWNEPLYTIGGRHLINQAITICGGENVFAKLTIPAPSVSIESVLAAAPEVIMGGDDAGSRPPWLDDWRRWPNIPAVRHGNLFGAAGDLLHRPGPRFLDGVTSSARTWKSRVGELHDD